MPAYVLAGLEAIGRNDFVFRSEQCDDHGVDEVSRRVVDEHLAGYAVAHAARSNNLFCCLAIFQLKDGPRRERLRRSLGYQRRACVQMREAV